MDLVSVHRLAGVLSPTSGFIFKALRYGALADVAVPLTTDTFSQRLISAAVAAGLPAFTASSLRRGSVQTLELSGASQLPLDATRAGGADCACACVAATAAIAHLLGRLGTRRCGVSRTASLSSCPPCRCSAPRRFRLPLRRRTGRRCCSLRTRRRRRRRRCRWRRGCGLRCGRRAARCRGSCCARLWPRRDATPRAQQMLEVDVLLWVCGAAAVVV